MPGYQTPKHHLPPYYYDNFPYGKPYEKPTLVRVTKMSFPTKIMNTYAGNEPDYVCRQCSS